MADQRPSIAQSFAEYGRGIAGGLLFSLPMLYTEEVWQRGAQVRPLPMLLAFLFTFILLLGYNRYAGLRQDASWVEVAIDSIEELGLGIVVAGLVLWLIDRVYLGMSLLEMMNRILLEALVVAVGVSVGTAQLGASQDENGEEGQGGSNQGIDGDRRRGMQLSSQVILGACGAFLIASNIAPTIEIVRIGSETAPWKLLVVALVSMALGVLILFFSNFVGTEGQRKKDKLSWLEVVRGGVLTYAVALAVSAFVLWFFGRFDGAGTASILAFTITAGLPAALGASAGRLLLQQ